MPRERHVLQKVNVVQVFVLMVFAATLPVPEVLVKDAIVTLMPESEIAVMLVQALKTHEMNVAQLVVTPATAVALAMPAATILPINIIVQLVPPVMPAEIVRMPIPIMETTYTDVPALIANVPAGAV